MTADTTVEMIRNVVEVLVLAGGTAAAVFFFLSLTPNLALRISPKWAPGVGDLCVLTLTIENTSRVRLPKKCVLLGISDLTRADIPQMTEMFTFTNDNRKEICQPTQFIYPGKRIEVDWIVRFDSPQQIKHVCLQVQGVGSPVADIVNRERGRPRVWTTTAFVFPPDEAKTPGAHETE